MIDDITGLPLLSSDIYQIPLNTDAIPYNDLQAEARLPRQPMLPDDIIPTIALTTGLRSDGTGEVVHTDDHHAQWVYVVNQPAPVAGGGGGGISPNHFTAISNIQLSGISSDNIIHSSTVVGTSLITHIRVEGILNNIPTGFARDLGQIMLTVRLRDTTHSHVDVGMLFFNYDPTTPQFAKMYDIFDIAYPNGLDVAEMGFAVDDEIQLYVFMNNNAVMDVAAMYAWRDS